MSSIRSKDTKPEITIRKMLWAHGHRYRIHSNKVFGKPDILFAKNRLAVFIDGCFWHGCSKCYKTPRTNSEFWKNKIKQNKLRREKVKAELKKEKWRVAEFWEHDIKKNPEKIFLQIQKSLN